MDHKLAKQLLTDDQYEAARRSAEADEMAPQSFWQRILNLLLRPFDIEILKLKN